MTQAILAAAIGVYVANISEMALGLRPICKEMAKRLGKVLDMPYKAFSWRTSSLAATPGFKPPRSKAKFVGTGELRKSCKFAHSVLAAEVRDAPPTLGGLQNLDDLKLGELGFAHMKLLLPVWTRSLYLAMDLVYGDCTYKQ